MMSIFKYHRFGKMYCFEPMSMTTGKQNTSLFISWSREPVGARSVKWFSVMIWSIHWFIHSRWHLSDDCLSSPTLSWICTQRQSSSKQFRKDRKSAGVDGRKCFANESIMSWFTREKFSLHLSQPLFVYLSSEFLIQFEWYEKDQKKKCRREKDRKRECRRSV